MKLLIFLTLLLFSCTQLRIQDEVIYFSSRDLNDSERAAILKFNTTNFRELANTKDCFEGIGRFLTPNNELSRVIRPAIEEIATGVDGKTAQADLLKLSYEELEFKNGKPYIALNASAAGFMRNYEYDKFLEKSIEVIYVPYEPFGHIAIRVGKYVYAFNAIQRTMSTYFKPIIHPFRGPEKSSFGFIFMMDKEKIAKALNEIEDIFKNSQEYNLPPFDAYGVLIKIEEIDRGVMGKGLRFVSDSPKLGNNSEVRAKIVEIEGKLFLQAPNGYKVPVIKKGKQYYAQSYSCSTVASRILREFFGINIAQDASAKYVLEVLKSGNPGGNRSPDYMMRYYEEK